MLQFLKFFLLSVLLFSTPVLMYTPVRADQSPQNIEIKKESINPGSIYYPLKRVWEKIIERIQFTTSGKISFHKSLLTSRLAELKYVVDNNLLNELQTSSERFSYQSGIFIQELSKSNQSNTKEKTEPMFTSYSKLLEQLRDKYSANSSFWMLIQHDINTLQILLQNLK